MRRNRTSWKGLADRLARFVHRDRGTKPRRHPARVLALEPLEDRTLLAVVTVSATDDTADEVGNDPGTFQISLADADPYSYYTVGFTLDGTAGSDDYLVAGDGCYPYSYGDTWYVDFQGETSKTITITPINDARNDPEQTVILNLTSIEGGCCCCGPPENSIGTPSSATITIADDDDDWTISLTGTTAGLVEAEPGTGTFTITRSGDTDDRYAITVDFTMSGVAQRGVDYVLKRADGTTLSGSSIAIEAGETSVAVTVDPTNESLKEPDEDVCMTLSSATSSGVWDWIGGSGCGCGCIWGAGGPFDIDPANNSATITILDDDDWVVGITAPDDEAREPGDPLPFNPGLYTLTRSPGHALPPPSSMDTSYGIDVRLDVGGTAIQETYGTDDPDYVLEVNSQKVTCWVTIPMWQTTVDIDLIVRGDALPEPFETAILTVILPDACCGGGGPDPYTIDPAHSSATVTIEDNDWTVSVGAPDAAADENYDDTETPPVPLNPGQFQITRTGSGANDHPLEVKFEIPHGHLTDPPYEWRAVADVHPQAQWDYSLEAIDDPAHPGAGVSLAYNAERNLYEGTATIPEGSDVVDIKLVPNDDEYIESFEMPEVVTLKAVPDDGCGCGGEPGICYVVDPENDRASVTIEDNDAPELFAVSYQSANFVTTDPAYVGPAFAGWDVNTLIDKDHWFDKDVGLNAGLPAGHPTRRHTKDRAYPVSYVRNTSYVAKAEWLWVTEPGWDTGYDMYACADGPECLDTAAPRVSADHGNKVSSVTVTALPFVENKIRHYPSFQLNWEYAVIPKPFCAPGPLNTWQPAGQDVSELYVTWAAPTVDPLYHTLVHIGTTKANGTGGTVVTPVVTAIWSDFTDLEVHRRDGTLMKYYDTPAPGQDTFSLLRDADGRCGAWARMFRDVFLAQGVPAISRGIVQKAIPGYLSSGFCVDPDLEGQGHTDPPYQFPDHGLVIVDGKIYDPSYGKGPYDTLSDWEDAALLFMIYIDPNDPDPPFIKPNTPDVQDMEWLPF